MKDMCLPCLLREANQKRYSKFVVYQHFYQEKQKNASSTEWAYRFRFAFDGM